MPGQTLADFDLIYPRKMWKKLRLPPFPPPSSVLVDGTPELERDLAEAFDLVSLIAKKDGSRRSIDGVNRAAQHRWPERRIYVDLVDQVLTAWQMAGQEAVVELVAGGKEEWDGNRVFRNPPGNAVHEMAATFHEPQLGSELFVSVSTLVRLGAEPSLEPRIYLVSVLAHFGQYRFNLACLEPPQLEDVSRYCCWHTRIAPA